MCTPCLADQCRCTHCLCRTSWLATHLPAFSHYQSAILDQWCKVAAYVLTTIINFHLSAFVELVLHALSLSGLGLVGLPISNESGRVASTRLAALVVVCSYTSLTMTVVILTQLLDLRTLRRLRVLWLAQYLALLPLLQ